MAASACVSQAVLTDNINEMAVQQAVAVLQTLLLFQGTCGGSPEQITLRR